MNTKRVILNNKTRKGAFWYVKEKGQRGAYYDASLTQAQAEKKYAQQYIEKPKIAQQKSTTKNIAAHAPIKKDYSEKGVFEKSYNAQQLTSGTVQNFYSELQKKLGTKNTKAKDFKKFPEKHVFTVSVEGKNGVLGTFQDIGSKNLPTFVETYLSQSNVLAQGGAVPYHWSESISAVGNISTTSIHRIQSGVITNVVVTVTYDNRR